MKMTHPDIQMTSNELPRSKKGDAERGGQCHQDLLIYWTQWSVDQDGLLIKDECLNNTYDATLILDDLIHIWNLIFVPWQIWKKAAGNSAKCAFM